MVEFPLLARMREGRSTIRPWCEPDWDDLPVAVSVVRSPETALAANLPIVSLNTSWPGRNILTSSEEVVWKSAISQVENIRISVVDGKRPRVRLICSLSGVSSPSLYFAYGHWIAKSTYRKAGYRGRLENYYYRYEIVGLADRKYSFSVAESIEVGGLLVEFGTGDDPRLQAILEKCFATVAGARAQAQKQAEAERTALGRKAETARRRANVLRQLRRDAEADPMGSEFGLRAGRRAVRRGVFAFPGPVPAETARLGPLAALTGPKAVLEAHARLDLRVLFRAGALRPGARSRHVFRWEGEFGPGDMVVEIDLPVEGPGKACVLFKSDGAEIVQEILMVVEAFGHRRRPWFVCPVGGGRCEVLAFREGRFAAIGPQRLQHRSQTGPQRSRKSAQKTDFQRDLKAR